MQLMDVPQVVPEMEYAVHVALLVLPLLEINIKSLIE